MLEGLRTLFSKWEVHVMSTVTEGSYPLFDLAEVNKCDLFVLGGGELIRKDCLALPAPCHYKFKNHSLAYKLYSHSFYAKNTWVNKIKTPKAIIGCGVESTQIAPHVIKNLQQFDYIGLRDYQSITTLNNILPYKASIFYDPAYALYQPITRKRKDRAIIFPTDRTNLKTVPNTETWLAKQIENYPTTLFIPLGQKDNNDYTTCKELEQVANSPVTVHPDAVKLENVLGWVAESSFAVAYRLHGLILAHLTSTPYTFFPYHPKLTKVHQTVTQHTPMEISDYQQIEFDLMLEALSL